MNYNLMLQLMNDIPPQKLGQLVERQNQPDQVLGQGVFGKRMPGYMGRGPITPMGTGRPVVR